MARRRYRRDFIGHFATPPQTDRPCVHACCRGMRSHPENWPVHLPSRQLRSASDQQLADYYGTHGKDTPADSKARDQVIYEMNRRDRMQERRAGRVERHQERRASRRHERAEAVQTAWLAAERGTKGNMLNRRGQEAGIDERTLFTGPESRVRKYGSEELLNWFEDHPRPTEAYFQGRDTRMGYAATRSPRSRMSTEEAQWRDYYERAAHDFEHAAQAA